MKIRILLMALLFLWVSDGFSAEVKKDQVEIKSNKMEIYDDKKMVLFIGDVVAKRETATIFCDRMEVFYIENAVTKKKEADHIIGTGRVKVVTSDGRTALGDKAEYFKNDDKIILEGRPAVIKEKEVNSVTGSRITFYLFEKKSFVEGDRPRVIFEVGK